MSENATPLLIMRSTRLRMRPMMSTKVKTKRVNRKG
ncbi:MAG: hypothetical protein A4E73_01087 [Syntrophaceae bacterium PtaU1.Bin231]|nr:MAG: hypothetical protein A4E73_01087 [Syntrophaceae bacterium PtaU1.Bin231]